MPKYRYVAISESRHYDWVCESISLTQAKSLLKQEDTVVYIFQIPATFKGAKTLKLNFPFSDHYNCLEINKNVITIIGDQTVTINLEDFSLSFDA